MSFSLSGSGLGVLLVCVCVCVCVCARTLACHALVYCVAECVMGKHKMQVPVRDVGPMNAWLPVC